MRGHQKETVVLRQCILQYGTQEAHLLEVRLTQTQRDQRCVQSATRLMALLTGFAFVGLGYCAIFSATFPENLVLLMRDPLIEVFCVIGSGAFISTLVFSTLCVLYRRRLDQRHEECRRLIARVLASHLDTRMPPPPGENRMPHPSPLSHYPAH